MQQLLHFRIRDANARACLVTTLGPTLTLTLTLTLTPPPDARQDPPPTPGRTPPPTSGLTPPRPPAGPPPRTAPRVLTDSWGVGRIRTGCIRPLRRGVLPVCRWGREVVVSGAEAGGAEGSVAGWCGGLFPLLRVVRIRWVVLLPWGSS